MRIFYDLEFSERGNAHPIIPISVGMVREDGAEFYAVFKGLKPARCNEWVRQNVLPLLPPEDDPAWMTQAEACERLVAFCGPRPEFWASYGAYDHVCLYQLFGAMVDLPEGWPKWTRDLQFLLQITSFPKDRLPEQTEAEHNALHDARALKAQWEAVMGAVMLARSFAGGQGAVLTDLTDRHLVAADTPLGFDPDDYPVY